MTKTELMLLTQTGGAPTMNLQQIADLLGVQRVTAENRCYAGTIPFTVFKVGSKWAAKVEDVARYIDAQHKEAAA